MYRLQVVSGTGGEESKSFSKELFDLYLDIFKHLGVLEKFDCGEQIIIFKDVQTYDLFLWERGVHRVQRIPESERSGRIHTSTVCVIVGEHLGVGRDIDPREVRTTYMKSSGPGGQHVNKTMSAVELLHYPTQTIVRVNSSRFQEDNHKEAWRILRERVKEASLKLQQRLISEGVKETIGNKDRADKVRTYNFNRDMVLDHRTNVKVSLKSFFTVKGGLGFIRKHMRAMSKNEKSL